MKKIQKALCLIAGLAMVAAPMAFADTVWTGNENDQLNTAGNWDNGLPTGGSVGTVTDSDVTYSSHNGIELAGYEVVFNGASTFTDAASGKSSFILQDGAVFTYNDTTSGFLGSEATTGLRHLSVRNNGTFNWNSTGTLDGITEILLASDGTAVITQSAGLMESAFGLNVAEGYYALSGGTVVGGSASTYGGLAIGTGTLDFLTTGTTGSVVIATGQTETLQGFITEGKITVDGAAVTLDFFSIIDDGYNTTLTLGVPNPPTGSDPSTFLGGEFDNENDWDNGFPVGVTGLVANAGTLQGDLDVSSWKRFVIEHTGGTLSPSPDGLNLSGSAIGIWNQSGGAISTPATKAHNANELTYNLSGGTSTCGYVNAVNGGTFNQTGGSVSAIGTALIYQALDTSVVNLLGGTATSTTAAAALNLDGGTINVGGGFSMEFTGALLGVGSGTLAFSTNWTGSFTRDSYTEAEWQGQLVEASGSVSVEGEVVTDINFSTLFSVANAGAAGSTLTVTGGLTLPPTESTFLGGNLDNAADWSDGFPVNIVGTVAVDGIFQGNFGVGSWGTFVVNHTAGTLSPSPGGFNLYGNVNGTWNQSGGAINAPANRAHFANSITYNLSGGTSTAGWVQATGGGTFTQTGGSVTAIGSKIYTVTSGSVINLLGGTGASTSAGVALAPADGTINVGGDFSMEFTGDLISSNSVGTVDFSTDWSGSFVRDNYTEAEWQAQLVAGTVAVDGTVVTDANFSTLFVVENADAIGSSLHLFIPLVSIGDIVIAGPIAGGDMTLSWQSVSGQSYEVQATDSLVVLDWETFATVTGTGGELTVPVPADQPEAFYRVISNPN